jgi:hypothetical protein
VIASWALPAALAGTVPGFLAWLLARRYGLRGLLGALALCAVLGIVGWNLTREVLAEAAMTRQAGAIFYVVVPGVVSLILGAVAGFWAALDRRP